MDRVQFKGSAMDRDQLIINTNIQQPSALKKEVIHTAFCVSLDLLNPNHE